MRLIILIGCPCSGKSTFALPFERDGYTIISQDTMGKKEHFKKFLQAILEGKNIVLDRMNFNKQQRKKYIDNARINGYTIHIVEFLTPRSTCLQRGLTRTDHPTIKDRETLERVIKFFEDNYEAPTKDEYDTMEFIG